MLVRNITTLSKLVSGLRTGCAICKAYSAWDTCTFLGSMGILQKMLEKQPAEFGTIFECII